MSCEDFVRSSTFAGWDADGIFLHQMQNLTRFCFSTRSVFRGIFEYFLSNASLPIVNSNSNIFKAAKNSLWWNHTELSLWYSFLCKQLWQILRTHVHDTLWERPFDRRKAAMSQWWAVCMSPAFPKQIECTGQGTSRPTRADRYGHNIATFQDIKGHFTRSCKTLTIHFHLARCFKGASRGFCRHESPEWLHVIR